MATQDQQLTSELLANQSGSALRLLSGVLDAPGSGIRNILAGRNPLTGLFDLDRRITGRGLAEQYGLGANKPGLDTGDVIGFLTDVFTDPLTYLTFGAAAAGKAGKIAQAADLMPGAIRDVATGELMQGRRTLARTTTLGQRLEKATPLQKLQAEAVAKQLGTTLEKEIGNTLSRDVAIDVPFLGRLGEFNVLSKPTLEALDQAGHTLRASPIGRLHAQLFTKGAQGTKSFPVQIAMEQATREGDMAARKYAEQGAQARMDLKSIGLEDTNEYRRLFRGAVERTNPANPRKKFGTLREAVEANLPDRLRTPENVDKATTILKDVAVDPTEFAYKLNEQYGTAVPRTDVTYADYLHREATDPEMLKRKRGNKRALKTSDEFGARSFRNVPGGSNVIEDVMNDEEIYHVMHQTGFKERNLMAEPRQEDLKALEDFGFGPESTKAFNSDTGEEDIIIQPYERQDLTRNQAKKMVDMGKRDPEQISRAQMPPGKYKNYVPKDVSELIAEKHFKWTKEDFDALDELRKNRSKLDDNKLAELAAYEDQLKVADDLAKSVAARPLDLIQAKRPYYGNDPMLDQMNYIAHMHEKAAYSKQFLKLGGLSAQRLTPGVGAFPFTEEFPGRAKPKGMTSLNEFIDVLIDPGHRKDPMKFKNDYNKSFAIRAIAPDLHAAGVIDEATLKNITGDHAVFQTADEAVNHYDGLMALNQIYVPDYIVEDMARIQGTLKDSNMMRGFLKYYDKALNVTKSNLTQPWPGFHVRNAYNMAWQMIVSGSYDPTYKRYDPRAYIKPLSDAAKLIRGETIEDAAKYFPAETLSNQQAMEKLRSIAFAHNTASGQHIFHSESNDVVGGFAEMTPDILKAMPGTVPEGKPGPMGMGYLAQGWKDLFTGKGGRNPLNVPGGREGKAFALQQGGAKASTYIESVGRTATMMARMKQGFDPDLAAMMSNAAHVRYDSLSNFEKQVMKRLVPFYCVPDDCEILTRRGFVKVDDLVVGEEVLALNNETGESEWVPCEDKATFDYNGQLVKVGDAKDEFVCTFDHKWPVTTLQGKKMLIETHLARHGYKVPRVSNYVSGTSIATPREAAAIAWVVTDGYSRRREHAPNHLEMLIYQSPGKFLDQIVELLGDDGSVGKPHPDTGVVPVRIVGAFRARLQELLGNKCDIVKFVCQLDKEAALACFNAMLDAEGSYGGEQHQKMEMRNQFAQNHGPVLEAFLILAQMCGYAATKTDRGATIRMNNKTMNLGKKAKSVVWYQGRIWCPSTKHGTWFMRRGNYCIWTGNTYARGMIPWQLKNLAEHPGGITAQTIRQFERAKGQGGFVPDYLQGSLAIPVGGEDKQGKQTFVTGFDLPFESINDYFRYGPDMMSTAGRTLREIGGQMSPALQLPAELAFNQSLYQGRNLKELDPALGRIAANLTGQDEPPFKTGLLDQLLMKSPASRYLATLKTLTDPRDPLVEQAIKKPLQLGTGVRFKDVNVEQQKDFAILEAIKDQAKGDRPFVTGEYVTVKKSKQDSLTPRQKRLLELYRERSKAIQDRKSR